MERIDNNSSTPLYKQIADILIEELCKAKNNEESKIVDKNDRLPTERKLSEIFNVSRVTIRQSMELLQKENYINRQQGKGTFLNRDKIVRPIAETKSFSNMVLESGRMPGAKLISASIELADKLDQVSFNITDQDYVLIMKRLRYADGEPCAYEVSHFNSNLFDLKNFDFNNKSIYKYLEEERGIVTETLEKTIEIIYSDEEISKVFNIRLNTPVILVKAIVCNQDGEIIHLVYEYLLSDKFIFKI
ncbi:GntR family transcriptional regulator [Helcococcus kunzii]|uniref:GntR family transcriptional regulator n=1 Tax=Helcococcus kunzii TaxID=40091 RepID=UPI0024AE0E3E|nr:GntR family transcriptional regulator [Helcococcus kunzii]